MPSYTPKGIPYGYGATERPGAAQTDLLRLAVDAWTLNAFAQDVYGTAGLVYAWLPGVAQVGTAWQEVAGGSLALPPSSTKYLERSTTAATLGAFEVRAVDTLATDGSQWVPMAKIVTGATGIASVQDLRPSFGVGVPGPAGPAGPAGTVTNNSVALIGPGAAQTAAGEVMNVTRTITGSYYRPVVQKIDGIAQPSVAPLTATDFHGLDVVLASDHINMNNLCGMYPLEGTARWYGVATILKTVGAYGLSVNAGPGGITTAVGLQAWVQNTGTGTITNAYGLQVHAPVNSGGGAITNAYGIKIEDQGAANWAIHAGTGKAHFGGALDAASVTVTGNLVASAGVVWGKSFQVGATGLDSDVTVSMYALAGRARQIAIYSGSNLRCKIGTAGDAEGVGDAGSTVSIMLFGDSGYIDSAAVFPRAAGATMTFGGTTAREASFTGHVGVVAGKVYKVGGTQVVGPRETGWTAGTGTPNKGVFSADTATAAQAAQRALALEQALRTHGLIN